MTGAPQRRRPLDAMLQDLRGTPLTSEAAGVVAAWERVVEALLLHRADAPARLAALLALDPDLVVGRVARGFALALLGRGDASDEARLEHGHAREALARRGGTDRERALTEALGAWLAGDQRRAAATLGVVLAAEPRDALSAKLAHACWFVLGEPRAMRAVTEACLPAWDSSLPGYGALLGCHAFALEELGELRAAERLGRDAVARDPTDVWACHAVAHVLEMEGRVAEGLAWLGELVPHHGHANNLRFHVAWHEALFHLARADVGAVVSLYDRRVRPEPTDDWRDVANAATLLWHLGRLGVDVGGRWEELADVAEGRLDDDTLAFATVHYGMALVGARRARAVDALLDRPRSEPGHQAQVLREVALPLVAALRAAADGRPAEVVERLRPVRGRLIALGGSRAQRDVFTRLLVDGALDAGEPGLALELLAERAGTRRCCAWATDRERVARARARAGSDPVAPV